MPKTNFRDVTHKSGGIPIVSPPAPERRRLTMEERARADRENVALMRRSIRQEQEALADALQSKKTVR